MGRLTDFYNHLPDPQRGQLSEFYDAAHRAAIIAGWEKDGTITVRDKNRRLRNMSTNNGNGHGDDPFDAASNATLAPRSYYGQVQIQAWFCVLVKGTGKVVYDPGQHRAEDRKTAIDISLLPLAEQNVRFDVARSMIAESREWAGVVWPSLKALGITSAREANQRWVKMQQVPSGRTYRNAKGEEKEATTFNFLALYANEDACRAAYFADGGTVADAPAEDAGGNGNNDHDLQVAIPFIKAFAKQQGFDVEKTKVLCKAQTIITKAIDVDSPEFAQIVADAMTGGAK